MSTDLLSRPAEAPAPAPKRRKRRRRFRFSLNALAIQLSAFALSVTLVALLVVSGSQAAFVEENEVVTNYVPIGTTDAPSGAGPRRPAPPVPPVPDEMPPAETAAPTTPPPSSVPRVVPSTVVRLTDNAAGTSMFGSETVLVPGAPSDRCIVVRHTGDQASGPVRLYAAAATGELAPYLDLVVDIGAAPGDAFGDCSTFTPARRLYDGTLADFAAIHRRWSSGLDTWRPAGSADSRAFRFTVTVQDVAAAEGRSVRFGFSWETRDGS
ncbi:hypothetical protein [Blastococcus sp. CCUG 61487]|uniref:hypothetical protein n=1 Tax=Blastococcus sp. CCUG 61487 TaxID=1840703 RepID=UPI00113746BD|nr:hypothetical protein [Blastococcus sp. CCUG 61487]TKJ18463.1 hypothetical protein A6V29_11635 [Blastococcus sp. CCUG 61487]